MFREKDKFVVVCLRPPKDVPSGNFTSWAYSDDKEIYQKVQCTCRVVVLVIKPITFLTFSLP